MKYKEIKRLTELVSEYRWEEENGLMVWIDYADCKEFFLDILGVRFGYYINCVATDDSMCISLFDDVLDNYTNENPEDIFPKKED